MIRLNFYFFICIFFSENFIFCGKKNNSIIEPDLKNQTKITDYFLLKKSVKIKENKPEEENKKEPQLLNINKKKEKHEKIVFGITKFDKLPDNTMFFHKAGKFSIKNKILKVNKKIFFGIKTFDIDKNSKKLFNSNGKYTESKKISRKNP